ncbi:MAG: hypothetical protein JNK78_08055 [Planctomycetes bacterium]|nr:hypothetical protein [Planctomycetota bacterium]
MNQLSLRTAVAAALLRLAAAQSMPDLTDLRNAPRPYSSVFQIEAGAIGSQARQTVPSIGADDDVSWDAKVYFLDESVGSRRGALEAYAGRDGIFASYTDGKLVGDDTVTRLEFRARPWMFYRDGFYRDGDFVANGLYEGRDYEGYIGFGREAQPGLYVELGPYYRSLDFDRSDVTPPTFTVPDGYSAYGGRLYLEQSTVQLDRRRGVPRDGFVLTAIGEREWNDSQGVFGATGGGFSTELPSAVWRVRGRLEWYIPASDSATWEIFGYGGWQDEKDRVQNFEGQRPLGNIWGDGQLRLRLHLGQSITLTPFGQLQFSRVLEEDGTSSTKDFFFGGGVETYVHLGSAVSLHGWYSFLDNDSRPSIRIDEDVHGEHMFYLGMVLRFGSQRR